MLCSLDYCSSHLFYLLRINQSDWSINHSMSNYLNSTHINEDTLNTISFHLLQSPVTPDFIYTHWCLDVIVGLKLNYKSIAIMKIN